MNAKHTPGPWTYAQGGNIQASAHFGFTIASVETFTGNCVCPQEERMANAILIAAAPDMLKELEALESLADAIEEGRHSPEVVDWHKTRNILRELIARAKGEI